MPGARTTTLGRPLLFYEVRGDALLDFSRDEEERRVKAALHEQSLIAYPIDSYGERIGAATAETMLDGPVGAVRFLLELMAARGIALQAGQWVSSGAVTGVHPVKPGDLVECRFGEGFDVECKITAS